MLRRKSGKLISFEDYLTENTFEHRDLAQTVMKEMSFLSSAQLSSAALAIFLSRKDETGWRLAYEMTV